jgi:hypothetical protein
MFRRRQWCGDTNGTELLLRSTIVMGWRSLFFASCLRFRSVDPVFGVCAAVSLTGMYRPLG